jgi:hypothetical protein
MLDAMKGSNIFAATLFVFFAALALPAAATISMDWVSVGDINNDPDPATGYGSVDHAYNIGTHEVTLGQYTEFLNATAASDPYGLYTPYMATIPNIAGISQCGSSGSFSYSVIGSANRPVTWMSWFDAARMANWMHNGQGSGSTEMGVYSLNGATSGTFAKDAAIGATPRTPCARPSATAPLPRSSGTPSVFDSQPSPNPPPPEQTPPQEPPGGG